VVVERHLQIGIRDHILDLGVVAVRIDVYLGCVDFLYAF
jgi:hypothetical protein